MEFLHNLDPMILSYDLNSRHVMIDEDLTAKINMSDCRFSFCDRNRVYNPAWMSPEGNFKKNNFLVKRGKRWVTHFTIFTHFTTVS